MYQFIDLNGTHTDVAQALVSGLTATPKSIPGYYIYDERGSKLFDRICTLPEYYLTRTELRLLAGYAGEMVAPFKNDGVLVELGCGNLFKTELLIKAFLEQRDALHFVAVDICSRVLEAHCAKLHHDYGVVDVTACCGEYLDCLSYLSDCRERKLVVWLGSSIGNFDRRQVVRFLRRLKCAMGPEDGLLIGVDLKKDPQMVERAYNDAQGVTTEYHLNVLHRLNREFGADFKVHNFFHRSFYDSQSGKVEAFIISRADQSVHVRGLDLKLFFRKGEQIFNELSCKYSLCEMAMMAREAQLSPDGSWIDDDIDYALVRFRSDS